MKYYHLIAGLPDIEIEDNKLTFSIVNFRNEVRPQLSMIDARLMDLFYMKFDNQNLLRYLKDKETPFDERGNITKDEMEECFRLIGETNKPKNKFFLSYYESVNRRLLSYFKPVSQYFLSYCITFVSEYRDAQQADDVDDAKWENRLAELYYRWAMNCNNKLIADWFEFNLNLNNILAATISRKYKMSVDVVGDNKVSESIKTSKQRDFGLGETIEDLDIYQRIADEADFFEREKKIDLLKWQWLDEQTFFKYFSIEVLFAYLIKLEIIERWVSLDPVEGGKLFRKFIESLKDSVVNSPESINLQTNEL